MYCPVTKQERLKGNNKQVLLNNSSTVFPKQVHEHQFLSLPDLYNLHNIPGHLAGQSFNKTHLIFYKLALF